VVFHIGHNFRHYERHGALRKCRGNRSASALTRRWAFITFLLVTAAFVAWANWEPLGDKRPYLDLAVDPKNPHTATHLSLLGLTWACCMLCCLLDPFLPKGTPRERTIEWYLAPTALFTLWTFFVPGPFGQPTLPVMSAAFLWAITVPAALVLAALFATIGFRLRSEEPSNAARRFGSGVSHEELP